MARGHGRITSGIWDDQDFLALTPPEQRLYFFLITQANLNHAGVLPVTVRRWSRKAATLTAEDLTNNLRGLHTARFVVLDEETEEVLIRTFIRNDGLWKQPRMMGAMVSGALEIESPALKAALLAELDRIPVDELNDAPTKQGPSIREQVAGHIEEVRRAFGTIPPSRGSSTPPSETPSAGPSAPPSEGTSPHPAAPPSSSPPAPTSPTPGTPAAREPQTPAPEAPTSNDTHEQGDTQAPPEAPEEAPAEGDEEGRARTRARVDAHARTFPLTPYPFSSDYVGAGEAAPVTAQTIVGEWINHCRHRPPKRTIGTASRHIKELLAEGIDPDDIRRGMAAWMHKGADPSTIPSFVNQVMNAATDTNVVPFRGPTTPGHTQPLTGTDATVAGWLALAGDLPQEGPRS